VLVATGLVTALTQTTYSATAQSFVTIDSGTTSGGIYQNSQFALQRVKSYTQLIASPDVLGPVISQVGLSDSVAGLRSRVTARSPVETVLLDVTVTDTDAARAAQTADAASRRLGIEIERLEGGPQRTSGVTVTLTRPADIPRSPVSPRPLLNAIIGLLLGAALGFVSAVALYRFDNRIRTAEDVTQGTGISLLGVVPFDKQIRHNPLVALLADSGNAEAYRTVRTNLEFVDVDRPLRSMVLTSSLAQEGKSTLAANLGIVLTQAGFRVLVVEADLRRPRVMALFGIEGAVGLTNVLAGSLALDDALVDWGLEGLSLLPAGAQPPDPQALLGSGAMLDLMSNLSQRFDVVIYDAPPLGLVTDAAILARHCDGAIVVARRRRARLPGVRACIAALTAAGARTSGIVLTFGPATPAAYAYTHSAPASGVPAAQPPRRRRRVRRRPARPSGLQQQMAR